MAGSRLPQIADAPLFIVPRVLDALQAYRAAPKEFPGADGARLRAELDGLTGRLLAGVEAHPTRFWVLTQFRKTQDALGSLEPAARQQVGMELGRLADILGIADADGTLGFT